MSRLNRFRFVLSMMTCLLSLSAGATRSTAQTGSSGYPAEPNEQTERLVPGFRFTNDYLFPSGPNYYECCTPPELVVSSPVAGTSANPHRVSALPGGSVTLNEKSPNVMRRTVQRTCVNLSELSPLERLLRETRATLGNCVRFVTYDQFPCSCDTQCNDPDWLCNCPGIAPGQLPEIGPQDSLRSRPEFLGTTCTPCGSESTCAGQTPPPAPPA